MREWGVRSGGEAERGIGVRCLEKGGGGGGWRGGDEDER